jgi:hypothetical protein
MKMLAMERQNGTSAPEESASKEGKHGEKTPSTIIDDAPWDSKLTSMNHELETPRIDGSRVFQIHITKPAN